MPLPLLPKRRRSRGTTVWLASRSGPLVLAAVLLPSGCEAPDTGQAELLNESGRGDLEMVIVDTKGRARVTYPLDEKAYLDTQWVERELQCLVAEDGHFEVRDSAGEMIVRHDFADRPVCEGDVIVLGPDGSLTWQ